MGKLNSIQLVRYETGVQERESGVKYYNSQPHLVLVRFRQHLQVRLLEDVGKKQIVLAVRVVAVQGALESKGLKPVFAL
jgi:hypothetical protein